MRGRGGGVDVAGAGAFNGYDWGCMSFYLFFLGAGCVLMAFFL